MRVKEHKTRDGRIILAICDSSLVGKKFEEGGLQLDLSSNFYKGEEVTEEQLTLVVQRAYMISFVGKAAVKFGIEKGLINREKVIVVAGIPSAQVLI